MFRKITLFIAGIMAVTGASAQCPTITCPGNITVTKIPNTCGQVVTFTAPVGIDACNTTLTDVNFAYTGAVQTWTVPAGVTEIIVEAKGAGGGQGFYYSNPYGMGGTGGKAVATVPVTPGQVINIYVGQKGGDAGNYIMGMGGWNGGGNGGNQYYAGGGGGGATDVRIGGTGLSNRKVVAGGAGGGGANCNNETGGDGGGATGNNGWICGYYDSYTCGQGGTSSNGGGVGSGNYGSTPGSAGTGGTGYLYGGGGGGGGWYGGGGGAYSGGGGGSSYSANTNTNSTLTTGGGNSGNGSLKISYLTPPVTTQTAGLPSGSTFPVGVTTNTFTTTSTGNSTTSCSFTVTVVDPQQPVFSVQPADSTRVCFGGTVTLTGTASNANSYQWLRNNVPVVNGSNITGATTNTLTITNFGGANLGNYTLRATGPCVQTTSNIAHVVLGAPAAVTTQPQVSQNICVGNAFNLSVVASEAGGYQWYRNGNPLSNGGDVGGATSSTLSIINADAGDIGAYTVAIAGNSGCTGATSAAGNVQVNPAVAITSVPLSSVVMCAGTPLLLDVVANNGTGYQWYKNGNPLANGGDVSGATSPNLSVANADNTDAGTYHVVVMGNPGCNNVPVASSSITVNNAPVITSQPQTAQNVCAGTTMIANVVAQNGMGYQWYKNGVPVNNGGNITGAQGQTLQITNTGTGDGGNYTVVITAQTACPPLTSNASAVTINPNASVITQPAPIVNICEGNSIRLNVAAGAAGSYQWYKNGNALTNGLGVTGATTNSLKISDANLLGTGTYNVMMTAYYSGCAGATSANSQVTVSPLSNLLAPTGSTQTYTHPDGDTYLYTAGNCDPIVKVEDPTGGNALGSVISKVTVDGTVQSYGTQPYVQRHTDVEPASNGLATVTLYASQQDFDAYNAYVTTYIGVNAPQMPTGGINNGNIKVWQFHGTGTMPGNYTGTTDVLTPVSVLWNGNYWEIKVMVGGFSGFYLYTDVSLPIRLTDVSAHNSGNVNVVKWNTATEEKGQIFNVERSIDGRTFTQIGSVKATGKAGSYNFNDDKAVTGINYYRVQAMELDGKSSYSKVVSATVEQGGAIDMQAFPNPTTDNVTVKLSEVAGDNATIELLDYTGKVLKTQRVNGNSTVIEMNNLPAGMYILKYVDGANRNTMKINKQ